MFFLISPSADSASEHVRPLVALRPSVLIAQPRRVPDCENHKSPVWTRGVVRRSETAVRKLTLMTRWRPTDGAWQPHAVASPVGRRRIPVVVGPGNRRKTVSIMVAQGGVGRKVRLDMGP